MHLKSLTVKGFKSFASSTTLRFEPGITCVVGPNGSGKSNILDALSWVMGQQGAKNLRGSKMEDIIFAGTENKPSLGRAEVILTIDNSDGLLPIDYSEVSITRRMFRDGISEYEINGQSSRLSDVQELLSDSGIGREFHVIVGQGQVAGILQSRPEDRRNYIEEAAGVLKHRKRKERAERKLQGTAANIARLNDLTSELRRQLKPLGKQAQAAKKAEIIAARLRDSRLRIAADDIYRQKKAFEEYSADNSDLLTQIQSLDEEIQQLGGHKESLQQAHELYSKRVEHSHNSVRTQELILEKTKASLFIAQDRLDHVKTPLVVAYTENPEHLYEQAERTYVHEKKLEEAYRLASYRVQDMNSTLKELEKAVHDSDALYKNLVINHSNQREKIAVWEGKIHTLHARGSEIHRNIEQLNLRKQQAHDSIAQAQEELRQHEQLIELHDTRERELTHLYEQAHEGRQSDSSIVNELQQQEKQLHSQVISLQATIEALEKMLAPQDGAGWLVDNVSDIAGSIMEKITVTTGYENIIALLLGDIAGALLSPSRQHAHEALSQLGKNNQGRASLISPHSQGTPTWPTHNSIPSGMQWAWSVVDCPPEYTAALDIYLKDALIADDDSIALASLDIFPDKKIYSLSGNIYTFGTITGGGKTQSTGLESYAELIRKKEDLAAHQEQLVHTGKELESYQEKLRRSDESTHQAYEALLISDENFNQLYEKLAALRNSVLTAQQEIHRIDKNIATNHSQLVAIDEEVAQLTELLNNSDVDIISPDILAEKERAHRELSQDLARLREQVMQAQLDEQSKHDKYKSIVGKSEHLRAKAKAVQLHYEKTQRAEQLRQSKHQRLTTVVAQAQRLMELITVSMHKDTEELQIHRNKKQYYQEQLAQLHSQLEVLHTRNAQLKDENHHKQVRFAQMQVLLQQSSEQTMNHFGIDLDTLFAEYGPDVLLPASAEEIEEYEIMRARGENVIAPQGSPYIRAEHEQIIKESQQELKNIGTINPLALEEFNALEERYSFLSGQLEDVKKTRADLEQVITEVEEHIEKVFTDAYTDIAHEFEQVFSTLFPGGKGWLELTHPEDMRTSGFEIHARPPGKKVTRLSLLSGGERSLTAVALLVSIFKARPSPFYIMDEVEAALDETNLRRLISVFEQLRAQSQLIVITHQKLMMETADILYGISMRGDGVSQVISQRMQSLKK